MQKEIEKLLDEYKETLATMEKDFGDKRDPYWDGQIDILSNVIEDLEKILTNTAK